MALMEARVEDLGVVETPSTYCPLYARFAPVSPPFLQRDGFLNHHIVMGHVVMVAFAAGL